MKNILLLNKILKMHIIIKTPNTFKNSTNHTFFYKNYCSLRSNMLYVSKKKSNSKTLLLF